MGTKGGKDMAEREDGAVIMNQKSCRNKAKQAQKPEEEQQVNAQTVVENSFEANSSVPQTFMPTGGEKKAIPRGAEKRSKKKKEGKDMSEREEGAVIMNQKSCRNKAKQVRILEEEQQVNAQIVVENSFEANSSVPQTFMHTGGEKKAIPRGAEKRSKKKKEGKDMSEREEG